MKTLVLGENDENRDRKKRQQKQGKCTWVDLGINRLWVPVAAGAAFVV
jgi:hypothetical protein